MHNEAYNKIQNLVEITYLYSPFIIFPTCLISVAWKRMRLQTAWALSYALQINCSTYNTTLLQNSSKVAITDIRWVLLVKSCLSYFLRGLKMKLIHSMNTSLYMLVLGTNYFYSFLFNHKSFYSPMTYHTNLFPNYQNIQRATVRP